MGLTLAVPVNCKVVQSHQHGHVLASYASMQGYRVSMEDAHSVVLSLDNHPGASLFGVYDGHGGAEASAFIARELPARINELKVLSEETIRQCILALDADFLRLDNEHRQHGSTAVIAVVRTLPADSSSQGAPRFDVLVANVGDSRCLTGTVPPQRSTVDPSTVTFLPLSEDHKPDLPGERTRISRAGGFVEMGRVDSRLALSRALGDSLYKANSQLSVEDQKVIASPEFCRTVCTSEHFLLVACDGVFERMSNEDVAAFVANELANGGSRDPISVLDRLLDHSLEAGSQDNMTAILVLFREDHQPDHVSSEKKLLMPDIPHFIQDSAASNVSLFVEAYLAFAEKEGFYDQAGAFLAKKGYGKCNFPPSTSSSSKGPRFPPTTIVLVSSVVLLASYFIAYSDWFRLQILGE